MTLNIERDISGGDQQDSFQNATLQDGPPGFEFSIAVHVDIPMIGVYDQETLAHFLERTFAPVSNDPRVEINVQMGRRDDYWWISDLEACEPSALTLNTGVEVRLQDEPNSHWPLVTLIAHTPEEIMRYIRQHWGEDDAEWLQQVESDIKVGDLGQTAALAQPLSDEEESSEQASIRRKGEEMEEMEASKQFVEMDPLTEAINNIDQAVRVIAPVAESMRTYGHSGSDDMQGALADLAQARRFLRGEEVPA